MAVDLPPIGTRWGDLTEEQRRALPVGTVLSFEYDVHDDDEIYGDLRRTIHGWTHLNGDIIEPLHPDRRILSYPEPTP